MENTIPSQGKKWISNAGFCRYLSFFARRDENTGFIVENTSDNGISMGEEEHKLGIRASSHVKFSLMKLKCLLKTCYLKEEMVSKLP
jgi:alkylation response protein AidB-like acyl-CoA dehydrogenase